MENQNENKEIDDNIIDSDDESIDEYTIKSDDFKVKTDSKEYMKAYYLNHKAEIKQQRYCKEKCEYCNREITHQQMMKHYKSKYCQTRRKLKQQIFNELNNI